VHSSFGLHLVCQLKALLSLHFLILVHGLQNDLLGLLRAKTSGAGYLAHRMVRISPCRILVHLVSNVFIEALLFLPNGFIFSVVRALVILDRLEVLRHNRLIEILLLGDLIFVALQGLLPGLALGRVIVLNHTMVHVRTHVATVM